MVEVLQELDLSKCSQTEHGVVEGGDLFDGDLLTSRLVDRRTIFCLARNKSKQPVSWFASHHLNPCGRQDKQGGSNQLERRYLPDDAVGTLANNVEDLVLVTGVEVASAWVGGSSHFRDGVAEALCYSRENGGMERESLGCESVGSKEGEGEKERV